MRDITKISWLPLCVVLNVICIRPALPFQPFSTTTSLTKFNHHASSSNNFASPPSKTSVTTLLHAKSPKDGLEESVQKKLVSESISPYRPLRLFLYGALGSGAAVGGLITLSAVAAGLSGARTDLDMNTEYMNLAIDFGAAAAFAFLFKFDLDRQAELDQGLEDKLEKKKELQELARGMRERERILGDLSLEIQISAEGDTKSVPVRDLQTGAKQHIIIVAGPKKACKDALVGAKLLKMDFAMSNVLVVPFDTERNAPDLATSDKGFGERPVYETQPYVARAAGDGWIDYIQAEMDDAVKQNGDKAREEGIAVVIANNGNVIRRGVGKVPWRQMVEQLEEEASGKKKQNSLF